MKTVLAIILIIIFLCIAAVHFYWAFGGKKWVNAALPTADGSTPVFKPRMLETLVVAMGFLGFVYIVACEATLTATPSLGAMVSLTKYGSWAIPIIFIARAIGDFKYAGFFKKIKATDFGRMDTQYYSPLCLIVGVISLIVKLL
jgi:glucan phosphoethanolaminetransferase (alkaline phosphatase superfamily)